MNNAINSMINAAASGKTGLGEFADKLRTPAISASLARLQAWMAARLKAHNDRVVALRVYDQYRVDGYRTYGRND